MVDKLDFVPGQWTLWVRMKGDDPKTATYQAIFTSSGQDSGQVTVSSGGTLYTGAWQEKGFGTAKENVKFSIQDPAGSGKELHFTGFMVGLAMGGYLSPSALLGALDFDGSWSAYKTGD